MGVLVLLGITVAVFAFTLGVHLGKQVGAHPAALAAAPTSVATQNETEPSQQELADQADSAQGSRR